MRFSTAPFYAFCAFCSVNGLVEGDSSLHAVFSLSRACLVKLAIRISCFICAIWY